MKASLSPRGINADESAMDLLAFEVARNKVGADIPTTDLLKQLHVDPDYFLELMKSEAFRRTVKAYKKEFEDNGISFQLRAGIIAEDGLASLYAIIHDTDEPGATRLKALEKAVEWANLAPKQVDPQQLGTAAPTIVFNFPEGYAAPSSITVVESKPVPIAEKTVQQVPDADKT